MMGTMWLLWCTLAAAATYDIQLPPDQPVEEWAECLALAGLRSGPGGSGVWVEILDRGDTWTIRAHGTGTQVRELTISEPRAPEAREDVALLSASLLRPLTAATRPPPPAPPPAPAPVATAPATPKPTPKPRPAPPPAPAPAPPPAPVPVPEPEPAPLAPAPAPVVEVEPASAPPARWEVQAGISAGLRADALPSPVVRADVLRRLGAFSLGLGTTGELPARLPDFEVAPTVASFSMVSLASWRPAAAGGVSVGVELGASLLFLADAEGTPLHPAVVFPRTAGQVAWASPALAGLGGVTVEPYVRAAVVFGALELLSSKNGDRDLSPLSVDVGVTVRFATGI